jgi:hypothetical protein
MRKAFAWGIGLLCTAGLCGILSAVGAGGQGSTQAGGFCLTGFIVLAALVFLIVGLIQRGNQARELAGVAQVEQQMQAAQPPQELPPQEPEQRQWIRKQDDE